MPKNGLLGIRIVGWFGLMGVARWPEGSFWRSESDKRTCPQTSFPKSNDFKWISQLLQFQKPEAGLAEAGCPVMSLLHYAECQRGLEMITTDAPVKFEEGDYGEFKVVDTKSLKDFTISQFITLFGTMAASTPITF